jgi:uncharacterized damage-inducible protein DinB
MDISNVSNPKAKDFLKTFFVNREINREFYKRVPEDKFDFRMVDKPGRKSDSPRESLAHQINVQRTYMLAVEKGELKFGDYYEQNLKVKSKDELLSELDKDDQELIEILADERKCKKKVKVPWSKQQVDAIDMLWGLDQHEVLHTGWNLAIMDHLSMGRFPALKKVWG